MKIFYKQDIGKKRRNNEDSIFVDAKRGIIILADGMGGYQGGGVASRTAVETAHLFLGKEIEHISDEKEISKLLVDAVYQAHGVIKEKSRSDVNLVGMGTTIVEMIIKGEKAHICHVGDSRVYILRSGIKQITKDQTLGNYLVEHGIMNEKDIPPQKWHTLTQAVGVTDSIIPELHTIELQRGDLLLLCSDGLTDMLTDEAIEYIIHSTDNNLKKMTSELIKEANRKGGNDNISVIMIRYE
jgi:serine/threonine protein phosphatase PrpC